MEQITYKPIHDGIAVRLANKQVGIIRQVAGGWTYYAKNSKTHGDIFATIQQVKYSIKSKSSRTKKAEPPPTCDVNRRFAAARGSADEPPNAWEENCRELKRELIAANAELDAIRAVFQHGADEENWKPGTSLAESVAKLKASAAMPNDGR